MTLAPQPTQAPPPLRRSALVTGAAGGMGRALARAFGETMDLVLTDISADALATFCSALRADGYTVKASIPGALDDDNVLAALAATLSSSAAPTVLLHTAGLSPSMGTWRTIMQTNLVATEKLLLTMAPRLQAGSVALLIASMAGHLCPDDAQAMQLMAAPLAPDFLARIGPVIERMAGSTDAHALSSLSYSLSKRAVIQLCETRCRAWGQAGARLVSLSPGTIWTPMGCLEVEGNPDAAAVIQATPARRWGTVMDITAAARFLASDAASFITGCDLRIDGGVTAALRT